ncbi:MAG: hypothetical protein PWR27_2348 [Petroclostridium sp.]|nr:hypothetical protein [Petroclostridium sp.]
MKRLGLYIHIPFCIQKCYYCDFNSYSGLEYVKGDYVDCLIKEMYLYKDKLDNIIVDTVYIGGGTPTCLEETQLENILRNCFDTFKINANCEVSIESNPGTLSRKKLRVLKQCGVNRLSIGLQSWDDMQLKALGRIHSKNQFLENYYTARQEGFHNINIDLMFSLPGQDLEQWQVTLNNVIQLGPEHVSCYALKIEEGTKFYDDYHNNRLHLPDEETDRSMYDKAVQMLTHHSYNHYEISNFAKKGFECRHNLIYWKAKEYIGIGAGAHSYLNGERYSNINSPQEYIKQTGQNNFPIAEKIQLNIEDKMSEYMFLGLRLLEGISAQEFLERFNIDLNSVFGNQLNKFVRLGLLEQQGDKYRLTRRGLDVSNQIFVEFI